jgi:taurine dioxygenase
MWKVEALAPTFAAKITGLDLRQPVSRAAAAMLVKELAERRVLVLPEQELSHGDYLHVTRVFGNPRSQAQQRYVIDGFPEILVVSNIFKDGNPIGIYDGDDEEDWHADESWEPTLNRATFLYSIVAPAEGGETRFADATAAYGDLPGSVKAKIDNLQAIHSMSQLLDNQEEASELSSTSSLDRRKITDIAHPVAPVHPGTSRRSLLLGSMIISGIEGVSPVESSELLQQLLQHATRERYVYRHKWSVGDLVVWDNRSVLHTASPCDHLRHQRLLHRMVVD